MFSFKTYSWVIGTTSFRVKEVNYKIEQQLKMLKELFDKYPKNSWRELQETYYDMLHENGFLTGNAKLKDKDAREKTSGLKELGLITSDRKLTDVGEELLKIIKSGKISKNNDFMIEDDAFLYLKQLLKVSVNDSDFNIRPFVALLYFIDKLGYITEEEFTYLLPICKDSKDVKDMVEQIKLFRNERIATPINKIILKKMYSMENYQQACSYFTNTSYVDEEVICSIGFNRKSKNYDKPYFTVYRLLEEVLEKKINNTLKKQDIISVLDATKKISGRAKNYWVTYLFGKDKNKEKQINYFNSRLFKLLGSKDESIPTKDEFRRRFFNIMHVYKWKVNLEEYADLNKRYFELSDILIFRNNKIELTLFAKHFFNLCIDELLEEKIDRDKLEQNLPLVEISKSLDINTNKVINLVNQKLGKNLNISEMRNHFKHENLKQLEELIKDKFTEDKLIKLLELIENREDKKIQDYVTDNADIPTIFEYLLGIIWYTISEYSFDILESWNLSLDANMLPKRHAGGGNADIVIDYNKSKDYNEHKLMLEATLTNSTNQRRAEMEPVSRHLGRLKADNPNDEVYGVFVSNHLDKNVIIDFRSRKDTPFYDNKTDKYITDNKIIPIGTQELRSILTKKIKYSELYKIFNDAYVSKSSFNDWYDKDIKSHL